FEGWCKSLPQGQIVEEIKTADLDSMKHPASRLLREAVLPPLPVRAVETN
ncbi:nickel ABC transporter ATP-binding protein, partial [Brucella suis bv. 4 str. 40]